MSFLSIFLPAAEKAVPHVEELITGFASLMKSGRAILDELPAEKREVQAAMTALETAVHQFTSAATQLAPKDATAALKVVESLVSHAKAAPAVAAKK